MEQIANNQATPKKAEVPTLQDVEKRVYGGDTLEAGSEYVNSAIEIATAENVEPIFNFDPSKELPESYGLATIPLTKRVAERGNQTVGLVIAAVPEFGLIINNDAGKAWLIKLAEDAMVRQIVSAAKPKDEGALTSLPYKLEDFITSQKQSGLLAYNMVGSLFVTALKKKGLKFMTKVLLRQVLASAAFAEQQFPRIAQSNWEIVLNSMVEHVKKEKVDAGVLKHWLDTRDQTTIDTSELDLSDIDSMVDGNDGKGTVETAEVSGQPTTA